MLTLRTSKSSIFLFTQTVLSKCRKEYIWKKKSRSCVRACVHDIENIEGESERECMHMHTLVSSVQVSVRWVEPYSVRCWRSSFLFSSFDIVHSFFFLLLLLSSALIYSSTNGHSSRMAKGQNGRCMYSGKCKRRKGERKNWTVDFLTILA